MKEHFIDLTDGTRIEVKINFGTLYYLQKNGAMKFAKRIQKNEKKKRNPSDNDKVEFAAKVIYAVLRSNGRKIDFDEALMLMPPDPKQLQVVIDAYDEEMKKLKKKQEAKMKSKKFQEK